MKNILVVFDHPYTAESWQNIPHERSYSAKIYHEFALQQEKLGNHVDLIDLNADAFNPVMSKAELQNWRIRGDADEQIQDYQTRVMHADEIWFIMPMWWELMPAMTKGFIDRVFTKRFLLGGSDQDKRALQLTNLKEVHLVTVQGTPKFVYTLIFSNAIIKAMFRGVFRKMKFKGKLKWHVFDGDGSDAKRQKSLSKFLVKLK